MEHKDKSADEVTVPERTKVRGRPPEHSVRHCFWKYPLIAAGLAILLLILAFTVGSPNWPRDTIAGVSKGDPGGAILAFTQELAGTAASWANVREFGMGDPDRVFVIAPLREFAPLLDPDVAQAVDVYERAGPGQRRAWAAAYERALATITPRAAGRDGEMATIPSPDFNRLDTLQGDFGPVPTLVRAGLTLAQHGYLDLYLVGVSPGHSLHLVNIWLYDHPSMLNAAVANGLTDDQWGMIKERGFPVGPWYLIVSAFIHVKLPGGSTGLGFVLWNLLFGLLLILVVPLMPGLRNLPRHLRLYRLIYRYPTRYERRESAGAEEHPGQ